jgi:hypothetical protein
MSFLTGWSCSIFAGYPQGYVVISPSGGQAGTYGFWMHSVDGDYLGYLQPGWLTAF